MKTKENVSLSGLHPVMRLVMGVCDDIYKNHSHELVITEALGGLHSPTSWHPCGRAIDIRTRNIKTSDEKYEVFVEIKRKLGIGFNVVLHNTHIHIAFNLSGVR